ncbi:hypothetical protein [Streptomyces sp. NPDC048663]|uniref:hypothetical protein n=1 Tax=Streptomyces sp. NPDC048663 TaxID=3155638 RepID=UPI00341CB424
MSVTDSSFGFKRALLSVPAPFQNSGSVEYRVQSVPNAAARIIPTGGRGIAWDRLRLWRLYGDRYREAMAATRSLRHDGTARSNGVDELADLAAVHLYLTDEWEKLDDALSVGKVGGHLSLARCLASGLRRLASYRGAVIVRTNTVGPVAEWYRGNQFLTEQAFWTASASAATLRAGGPAFVVWSLTARRTAAVTPHTPEQVIFLPGTRFKVLRVIDGRQPLVLMRELFPQETTEHSPNSVSGEGSTWLDESTLADLEDMTRSAAPFMPVASPDSGPQQRPPGLIVTSRTCGLSAC